MADAPTTQLADRAPHAAWRLARTAWTLLRQVSGDDAYERYREHMLQAHPGSAVMSRSAYYRFRMEQKWNRLTRCC
jgi:uncharacterized short protein YbdD (DUF466 family)